MSLLCSGESLSCNFNASCLSYEDPELIYLNGVFDEKVMMTGNKKCTTYLLVSDVFHNLMVLKLTLGENELIRCSFYIGKSFT